MTEVNTPKFTIKQLLEAGVHFGHKTSRRNPKMAQYIYGIHNDLHIINLQKTAPMLARAMKVLEKISQENGKILFVGTKKQASEIIAEEATRCGQYYVNNRWLGGMLTNWSTVSQSIKKLRKIEEDLANPELQVTKKERLLMERQKEKLEKSFGGIRNMGGRIQLVVVVDTKRENLAIKEAATLGVPVMAIVDTNSSLDDIDYIIPGNDDSIKAIRLYFRLFSDAILEGLKKSMNNVAAGDKKGKPNIRKSNKDKALAEKEEKVPAVKEEKVPAVKAEEKVPAVKEEAKVPAKTEAKTTKATSTKKETAKKTTKKAAK